MFNWFKKTPRADSIYEQLRPGDKILHDNLTRYAKQIGITDNMPLNLACWLILIEVKRVEVVLESKIKFLEDNAFADRARIIKLEKTIDKLKSKEN